MGDLDGLYVAEELTVVSCQDLGDDMMEVREDLKMAGWNSKVREILMRWR